MTSKTNKKMKETNKNEESYTKEQAKRLWEYRIQEENVFYSSINIFLIVESMLFVAIATILTSKNLSGLNPIPQALTLLGLIFTLIWIYVNWRRRKCYIHVRKLTEDACPEYKKLREDRSKGLKAPFSSWAIMTYLIPLMMFAVWALILIKMSI